MLKRTILVKIPATGVELENRAWITLKECLEAIPGANVVVHQIDHSVPVPDLVASVNIEGRQTRLIAEVKKNGEPKSARDAINQMLYYRSRGDLANTYSIFIAPYITDNTAKLCREEKTGYLDLAGNCHIAFPGVYVHTEGKSNPFSYSRPLVSLYKPKSERVLRAMLTHPSREWRIQKLADEANVV